MDLADEGLLPELPRAYLAGHDLDLLAPLHFLDPPTDEAATSAALSAVVAPEPPPGRERLAAELAVANRGWGHPEADRLGELLARPETLVVVTGQQPGLFGGPLYALSKMVAAERWAQTLRDAGRDAVAVFWMATEDHDWDEITRAWFLGRDGARRLTLGDDPDPLLPVGMRTLGPRVSEALAGLGDLADARGSDRLAAWVETLGGIYRPQARFGEAFAKLAVHLLKGRCPLLLDALAPAVKAAERPWLERLVERREQLDHAYRAADETIASRGYSHQVHPQPGASPLFQLHGGERRRIVWHPDPGGDGYELRGVDGPPRPVAELLETIRDNPSVVSPGVLARPAIQDAILGSGLFLLGPGEMSYMAQAAPTYGVLGVTPPRVVLRPQALVLESHQRQKVEETGVPLSVLLGDDESLRRRLAGGEATEFFDRARQEIAAALDSLGEPTLELDRSLERPLEKTVQSVDRALGTFGDKLTAAAARRDDVRAGRVERLRAVLRPEGTLQERLVAAAHFPGKYGDRFVDALFEQLGLDSRRLQVIEP